MESNRFVLECTSIHVCPETTQQKLESQRMTPTLYTYTYTYTCTCTCTYMQYVYMYSVHLYHVFFGLLQVHDALELCSAHHIVINEDMAERMTLEKQENGWYS